MKHDLRLSIYDSHKNNSFYYKSSGYKIGETFLTRKVNILKEKINEIKKGITNNERRTKN
jgi:hypothetical protein